jgi:hypothetical protein
LDWVGRSGEVVQHQTEEEKNFAREFGLIYELARWGEQAIKGRD